MNDSQPGASPTHANDWPAPKSAALQELSSVTSILKQALSMPWRQAGVLVVWAAAVPTAVSFLFFELMMSASADTFDPSYFDSPSYVRESMGVVAFAALLWIVSTVVSVAVSTIVQAFTAEHIRTHMLGYRARAREVWGAIRRVLPRVTGFTLIFVAVAATVASILVGILFAIFTPLLAIAPESNTVPLLMFVFVACVLGVFALVLWVAARLAFVPSALIFEGIPIRLALARSWDLTTNRAWRTLGVILLLQVSFSVLSYLAGLAIMAWTSGSTPSFEPPATSPFDPHEFTSATVLADIATYIILGLGSLCVAIATTLLYLDARTKSEHLGATFEAWCQGREQGVPAEHLRYPFASPCFETAVDESVEEGTSH